MSEEFLLDSLNRSCLCRHTGLGETCAGEVFQAGILVSPMRILQNSWFVHSEVRVARLCVRSEVWVCVR